MVDDLTFSDLLHRFDTDQEGTASANRLWFVQYLLIIAFGKAFLEHSSPGVVPDQGPPGSNYAARAMSLMPDAAQMHDEALPAIEALALAALYFQAIDMRAVAYQYVRLSRHYCLKATSTLHEWLSAHLFHRSARQSVLVMLRASIDRSKMTRTPLMLPSLLVVIASGGRSTSWTKKCHLPRVSSPPLQRETSRRRCHLSEVHHWMPKH